MSQDLKRAREIAAQTVTQIKRELDSPAIELADWLTGIADHLRANPQITRVNANAMSRALQIASFAHKGEPDEAAALILWHDSLIDPRIVAYQWTSEPTSAGCRITGRTAAGVELVVWDVVQQLGARLGFDEGEHDEKPITIDLLLQAVDEAAVAAAVAEAVKPSQPASQEVLDELAAPAPVTDEPCTYTFAHTRHWCGRPTCRES